MTGINKTVAAETPAGPLDGTELCRIVQGGNSARTTLQAIANLRKLPLTAKGQLLIYGTNGPESFGPGADGSVIGFDSTQESGFNTFSTGVTAAILAQATGSGTIGTEQVGTNTKARTVLNELNDTVKLIQYVGADPSGNTASDAALSNALNDCIMSGKTLDWGDSSNTWYFSGNTVVTGSITMVANGANIFTDTLFLTVKDCNNGGMKGTWNIQSKTVPYTIFRNTTTWATPTVTQSRNGYTPTSQDIDVWPSVTTLQRTTNAGIKTGILFTVSSSNGASGLEISGINGSQINLIVQGYINSHIHDNNFSGGGFTYSGLLVFNGVNRNYDSSFAGFTFPRGVGNMMYNNTIKFCSLSGICIFGQDNYSIVNNHSIFNGESGIKTYQYDGVAGPSETTGCISTTGQIMGNTVTDNYYDGIDATIYNGVTKIYFYTGTQICDNRMERNHQTGTITDGYDMSVNNNFCNHNGTFGMAVSGSKNSVNGNHTRFNMTTGTSQVAQPFEISLEGDDIASTGNFVDNTTSYTLGYLYFHSGALGSAPTSSHEGLDIGNYSTLGSSSVYVDSSIPSNRIPILSPGAIRTNGAIYASPAVPVTTSTYSVTPTDYSISFFTSATCTVTLPSASSSSGRILQLRNTAAFAINSASANISPATGGALTNVILAATAGKGCMLQSDGTQWNIFDPN